MQCSPLNVLLLGDSTVAKIDIKGVQTHSYPGWTAQELIAEIDTLSSSYNLILLSVGTNDLGSGRTVEETLLSVSTLIQKLRQRWHLEKTDQIMLLVPWSYPKSWPFFETLNVGLIYFQPSNHELTCFHLNDEGRQSLTEMLQTTIDFYGQQS